MSLICTRATCLSSLSLCLHNQIWRSCFYWSIIFSHCSLLALINQQICTIHCLYHFLILYRLKKHVIAHAYLKLGLLPEHVIWHEIHDCKLFYYHDHNCHLISDLIWLSSIIFGLLCMSFSKSSMLLLTFFPSESFQRSTHLHMVDVGKCFFALSFGLMVTSPATP